MAPHEVFPALMSGAWAFGLLVGALVSFLDRNEP